MIEEIKQMIAEGKINQARLLIKQALANEPSADTYYYAAKVALNDQQRKNFLEKALELDPFYAEAAAEYQVLAQSGSVANTYANQAIPSTNELATSAAASQLRTSGVTTRSKTNGQVWLWRILVFAGIAVVGIVGIVILLRVLANNQSNSTYAAAQAASGAAIPTATVAVPTPTPMPRVVAPKVGCLPEVTTANYSDSIFQACVTPKNPGQYSVVTVYARLLYKGEPLSGIPVITDIKYRFLPERYLGKTDSRGIAEVSVNTGIVSSNYPVQTDVIAVIEGEKVIYKPVADETIFTPQ